MRISVALGAMMLAAAAPASAAVTLFSENFDSLGNALAVTTTVGSMNVTGNVDVVAASNPYGLVVPSTVIDLDGTTGPGAVGKGGFNLVAGRTYTLSFVAGGAQRGSVNDSLFVRLFSSASGDLKVLSTSGLFGVFGGGYNLSSTYTGGVTIAGSAPFAASSYTLLANNNTTMGFQIGTFSQDNIGPLLDSVELTANEVPEPSSWAMLIAGFGLVGAVSRRRRFALVG